jgi:hypothetical protein
MADELLERNEHFLLLLAMGTNLPGLTDSRHHYVSTMHLLRVKAEKRLGAPLSSTDRSQSVCWKLLNRLRNPSTAVAINAETLIDHFEGIFYDRSEPVMFDLSALGIPCPIDSVWQKFTDEELVTSLSDLNAQAAVGPQCVSSKYIKLVFAQRDS